MKKTTFLEAYETAYRLALKDVVRCHWFKLDKRIRYHLKNMDKLKKLARYSHKEKKE